MFINSMRSELIIDRRALERMHKIAKALVDAREATDGFSEAEKLRAAKKYFKERG